MGDLNEEQTKQLKMVKGSAAHLLELINDILDISKIEADQLKIDISQFNLCESIEKVINTVTPMASKKGLLLNSVVDPQMGLVFSDRRRVEQILLNLINNAIKFTEIGKIELKCVIHDQFIETSIADTGIGISKEDLGLLFKPFQQVNTGLSRQYEGTGLGLAICKRLVEKLGGEIWVKSKKGKGSVFTFTLPLTKPESRNETKNSDN